MRHRRNQLAGSRRNLAYAQLPVDEQFHRSQTGHIPEGPKEVRREFECLVVIASRWRVFVLPFVLGTLRCVRDFVVPGRKMGHVKFVTESTARGNGRMVEGPLQKNAREPDPGNRGHKAVVEPLSGSGGRC